MTTAVIVQARMGSKRFPGKIMADLNGKPVLRHVLERCLQIRGADMVVLAMPVDEYTPYFASFACGMGVYLHAGQPENDVLSRYLAAAESVGAGVIMRITADCPRIDPEVCGKVLACVKDTAMYACNFMPTRTFEKGLDCEAFTLGALELADKNTKGELREHVTPWLYSPLCTVPRTYIVSENPKRAETNWCIDTPEDLERLKCA